MQRGGKRSRLWLKIKTPKIVTEMTENKKRISVTASPLQSGPVTDCRPERNRPERTGGSQSYQSGCSPTKCWEEDSEIGQRITEEGLVNNSSRRLIPGCNAGLPVTQHVTQKELCQAKRQKSLFAWRSFSQVLSRVWLPFVMLDMLIF